MGGAAYKLGQNSLKQVEEHTGKFADQLSEQELQAAMDELRIEEEEMTAQDQAAIEAEAIDTPASVHAKNVARVFSLPVVRFALGSSCHLVIHDCSSLLSLH